MSGLGRSTPPDWAHVEKYPLAGLPVEQQPKAVPVILGINWYTNFDSPWRDPITGRWWIGKNSQQLGSVRGGHCICVQPVHELDTIMWWLWYNQGAEGACTGFGSSRAKSLLDRKTYQPFWLYRQAQRLEGDPPGYEGAQVRSALEVLRTQGHVAETPGVPLQMTDDAIAPDVADPSQGIAAYRWSSSVDDILNALGFPGYDYVKLLNSWGESYPRVVCLPAETLQRLLDEDGEAAVITDR